VARAGGKVILFGEHGVVYGRPALAAGLSTGASAELVSEAGVLGAARLSVEPWGVTVDAIAPDPSRDAVGGVNKAASDARIATNQLAHAFGAIVHAYDKPPVLHVKVKMELPSGAGLGGSAALSVAIVRVLDEALGIARTPSEVADIALRAEKVFHGNPSGVDTAMAAAGGVAVYRKGQPLQSVRVKHPITLVIGHSGEPGMTKETVASVARQHAQRPDKVEQIFAGMEAIVNNGKSALERGDLDALGQLMELNQKLLVTLVLSTPRLEEMCTVAVKAGALGSKLTGGGGGGCMIALVKDAQSGVAVRDALRGLGREAFITMV
jgi:mevalonate kinase